jgi:hypothetical protein
MNDRQQHLYFVRFPIGTKGFALTEANNGNWHTAHRWAKFLYKHCDIAVTQQWNAAGETPDAMMALHARRSAPSIQAWAAQHPQLASSLSNDRDVTVAGTAADADGAVALRAPESALELALLEE